MNVRRGLIGSGAAGLLLAALIYLAALPLRGVLGRFLPLRGAEMPIFVFWLVVSLVEMPVMVFALRQMREERWALLLNAVYVAFAGVYAALFILVVDDAQLGALLAGLSAARWASVVWMR